LNQNPEQSNQNGHLDNHWAQTAKGAYTSLFVKAHCLLRDSRSVSGVTVLDLFDLWLKRAHGPHLLQLLQRQWHGDQTYQGSKNNDRQAHLAK